MSKEQLRESLRIEQFPLSYKYDPEWMCENEMGPSSIWLTEFLTQKMELKPGMRVLDMGCGRAMSSIFLAKEYGVQVWANDLWISATDNWKRIQEEGLEELIFPIHAEAHSLPYAEEFFDAIVSLDSYHYYGTDEMYFLQFIKLLKRSGQIGIVVPGLLNEFEDGVPETLEKYWDSEWYTFHSPNWWENHWGKTGLAEIEVVDSLPYGWDLWMKWEITLKAFGLLKRGGDIELLTADNGKHLGFTRVIARRK